MIRRTPPPPAGTGRYAFTGPPPATVNAMRELGARLRWVREHYKGEARGLRKWVALLAERGYPMDFNTVSRYELNKLQVPAAYVWMVARVAHVDAGWLLTGRGRPPAGYEPVDA